MACTRRPNAPRVRQRAASRAHPRTPATADWMRTTHQPRRNHFRHAIGRIPQRLGGAAPRDAPLPWEHTRCRDLPTARQLPLLINEQLPHAVAASPDTALCRFESSGHLWWSAVSKHAARSYPNVVRSCGIPSSRALTARGGRPGASMAGPRAPVRPRGLHCAPRSVRRQRVRTSTRPPEQRNRPPGSNATAMTQPTIEQGEPPSGPAPVELGAIPEDRRRSIADLLLATGAVTVVAGRVALRRLRDDRAARPQRARAPRARAPHAWRRGAAERSPAHEDSFDRRIKVEAEPKQLLARAAVELMNPHETVFLDSSTTSLLRRARDRRHRHRRRPC